MSYESKIKSLSLAPSRGTFYKTQWPWQGVKLTRLISIFNFIKVWKFLIKIQLIKFNPKRATIKKCPPPHPLSCQLGSKLLCSREHMGMRREIQIYCSFTFQTHLYKLEYCKVTWKITKHHTLNSIPMVFYHKPLILNFPKVYIAYS